MKDIKIKLNLPKNIINDIEDKLNTIKKGKSEDSFLKSVNNKLQDSNCEIELLGHENI